MKENEEEKLNEVLENNDDIELVELTEDEENEIGGGSGAPVYHDIVENSWNRKQRMYN